MDKQTKKVMLIGGAGIAVMFLLKNKKTAITQTFQGEPEVIKITAANFVPVDETFPGWYEIMEKLYPVQVNPNYVLSDYQAQQFLDNYTDVRQALEKGGNSSLIAAARMYWSLFGVAEKRTFLPLKKPHTTPYNGKGITFYKEKGVVQGLAEMANYISMGLGMVGGVEPDLKDYEVDVVFNGAAIIKPMLNFFSNDERSDLINRKLTSILEYYSVGNYGI